MKIEELRPRLKRVKTTFKVVEKEEPSDVKSRKDNRRHKVSDILVGDETGVIVMTLWDEDIEEVQEGETYELSNGYTSVYQGKLRLNMGRYGKLEKTEPEEEITVDQENNISEKTHEKYDMRRRQGRHRFGSGSFWPDH